MDQIAIFFMIAVAVLLADRVMFRVLKRRMGDRQPTRGRMIWAFSVWGILLAATVVCLFLLPLDLIWVSFTLLIIAHFSWKLIILSGAQADGRRPEGDPSRQDDEDQSTADKA